jgi:predicted metal-dependent hydrolase
MPLPVFDQIELPLQMPRRPAARQRHILLGSRIVAYTLTHSRRRTLGLTVDQRGLRVGAPMRVGVAEVENFIRGNSDWVLRKLDEWRASTRSRRMLVCDGAQWPFLGETWSLRISRGKDTAHWGERELELALREGSAAREILARALQQRALALFKERARRIAELLGCALPRVSLSNAQTRWGSCSHKTGLRFNWRLIHLPLHLIDYVVAHEMAHLAEMNHSARFWRQVERLYPDYRSARIEIRARALTIPQF